MDVVLFNSSFADILDLNSSEGPNYNIFEPKFEARKQMQSLMETVSNVYTGEKSWLAVRQICRCLIFMGTTMMEVEEEVEGMLEIRRAYALLRLCTAEAATTFPEDLTAVEPVSLDEIIAGEKQLLQRDHKYAGCVEFLRVHNAAGLYLSKLDSEQREKNAKAVLQRAEEAYKEWNEWFTSEPGAPLTKDLPVGDNGRLEMDRLSSDTGERGQAILRFEMDSGHTNTLFFLAQLYASMQDPNQASRYCHLTMYYQLLCKPEFDRKVWATNALQLSGFYSSQFAYGQALHCLQAGEKMMPVDNPDESTRGLVAWGYGRFHLSRLTFYGSERVSPRPAGPAREDFVSYWVNFPIDGVAPAAELPRIVTFDEAREAFKEGNKAFQEALSFHPFESACTSHIELVEDVSRLYGALEVFEDDRGRRIAMLQRRVSLIEDFPAKLSFNAYPVVVRQLLYDLGYLYEDIIRLRQEQRRNPQRGEKPLKDKPFNLVVTAAKEYYTRFIDTWRAPATGEVPAVLEADSRMPFFRALMRLAHVELCFAFPSPKDEYEAIGRTKDAYQRAVDFAEANKPLASAGGELVEKEIDLARDMVKLLPGKQREVWVAYQRSLQR